MSAEKIVSNFIHAFEQSDFKQMEKLLATNLVSHITNAKAGLDKVNGRDAYMKRVFALKVDAIKPSITITQMAKVNENQILVMVEVKANHDDKILYNYAAHLITIKNDKIIEMWMVEALPEYSDAFWK